MGHQVAPEVVAAAGSAAVASYFQIDCHQSFQTVVGAVVELVAADDPAASCFLLDHRRLQSCQNLVVVVAVAAAAAAVPETAAAVAAAVD